MKLQDRDAEYLTVDSVKNVERTYGAKFLGPWCVKARHGGWTKTPIDVFYVQELSKPEHYHYMGFYIDNLTGHSMICNAESFNSIPMTGMLIDDILYVSRSVHDYIDINGEAIDGGRDYLHTNSVNLVLFNFVDGEICLK